MKYRLLLRWEKFRLAISENVLRLRGVPGSLERCTCGPPGWRGYDKCRQLGCDPECPIC